MRNTEVLRDDLSSPKPGSQPLMRKYLYPRILRRVWTVAKSSAGSVRPSTSSPSNATSTITAPHSSTVLALPPFFFIATVAIALTIESRCSCEIIAVAYLCTLENIAAHCKERLHKILCNGIIHQGDQTVQNKVTRGLKQTRVMFRLLSIITKDVACVRGVFMSHS